MKVILALGLLSVLAFSQTLINEDFVAQINSAQSQWKATHENLFKGMSTQELKQFLGTNLENYEGKFAKVSYEHLLEYTAVPESFDARDKWGVWIHPIRDQARCGSCWAFGASEAFSDRLAIASNGEQDIILSPQYSVSCDNRNMACNGGYLSVAWQFFQSRGLPSDECVAYTSQKGQVRQCPKTCDDGSDLVLHKIKNVRTYRSAQDAKLDILTNGPIETGFRVYQDFMTYASGIYKHTSGPLLGGHAVKILGWGVENGIKYWIAANSWTENWGDQGYFRIQEGQCDFEGQLIAGDPIV